MPRPGFEPKILAQYCPMTRVILFQFRLENMYTYLFFFYYMRVYLHSFKLNEFDFNQSEILIGEGSIDVAMGWLKNRCTDLSKFFDGLCVYDRPQISRSWKHFIFIACTYNVHIIDIQWYILFTI